jgi:hypothetical protein
MKLMCLLCRRHQYLLRLVLLRNIFGSCRWFIVPFCVQINVKTSTADGNEVMKLLHLSYQKQAAGTGDKNNQTYPEADALAEFNVFETTIRAALELLANPQSIDDITSGRDPTEAPNWKLKRNVSYANYVFVDANSDTMMGLGLETWNHFIEQPHRTVFVNVEFGEPMLDDESPKYGGDAYSYTDDGDDSADADNRHCMLGWRRCLSPAQIANITKMEVVSVNDVSLQTLSKQTQLALLKSLKRPISLRLMSTVTLLPDLQQHSQPFQFPAAVEPPREEVLAALAPITETRRSSPDDAVNAEDEAVVAIDGVGPAERATPDVADDAEVAVADAGAGEAKTESSGPAQAGGNTNSSPSSTGSLQSQSPQVTARAATPPPAQRRPSNGPAPPIGPSNGSAAAAPAVVTPPVPPQPLTPVTPHAHPHIPVSVSKLDFATFVSKYTHTACSKMRKKVDELLKAYVECDWVDAKKEHTGSPQLTITQLYRYIEAEMIKLGLFEKHKALGLNMPAQSEDVLNDLRNHIETFIFKRIYTYTLSLGQLRNVF